MKTLVINQKKQHIRMSFQQGQLESLGMCLRRIPAYKLSGTESTTYRQSFERWQRPMSIPEVSCFLSHKKAWEAVLSDKQPMLILEDDAWLDPSTPQLLNELDGAENIDYITLEAVRENRKKLISKESTQLMQDVSLYRLYQGRSGAAGYILWPNGAKKLLDQAKNNRIGIADKFINACYSLKAYQVEPAMIIQLDQCAYHGITPPLLVTSTISSKTTGKPSFIQTIRYKVRRIIGEIKVGINFLKHCKHAERRHIIISESFKKGTSNET